jgi:polyferredoxin
MGKKARRRWTVLVAAQVVILLHIALWLIGTHYNWFGGKTLTPIEPSEGMEFVKNGVINAGAIFFALALLSTLVFGRWFCGWGCHIVLLQDFCYWIMRKLHIRPRPFRARLLMWFPLGLATYMYLWPLFYRFVLAPTLRPELQWPGVSTHLLTTEYWSTFAPPLVAIPFLLVCGFATVYVLGAKGFCTYGCPYGGFFKPLDTLSPMRVRVNDNCKQCGMCTAACTSNVKVHEEVNLYKMVIDNGCMKTSDCIDACPNDALSIGFGSNAVGQRKKSRQYDLSLVEELGVAGFFLVGFFAFRGLYATVPMLMAVGMSLVCTWVLWKGITVLRKPNASFHHYRLKFHGKIKRAGISFVSIAFLLFLFTVHSAAVGSLRYLGDVANSNLQDDKAYQYYKLSSPINDGGIGFASNPNVDTAMATILKNRGEFQEAERLLRRVDRRVGQTEISSMLLGQLMQDFRQPQEVDAFYLEQLGVNSNWGLVWEDYVAWLKRIGMCDRAIIVSKSSLDHIPTSRRLRFQYALTEMECGDVLIAVVWFQELTVTYPDDPRLWMRYAQALDKVGRVDESNQAVEKSQSILNAGSSGPE